MRESRISLRGGERRCEWTRIDSEQHIALLDIGTVLEIARNNLSIYLRLHLNHFRRGACTDFIQVERNIFGDNFCHCYGPRRWRRGCFLPACNGANCQKHDQKRDKPGYKINALATITSFKVCNPLPHCGIYVSEGTHLCFALFPFVPGARSIRSRTCLSTRMQTSMSRAGIFLINSRRSCSAVALIRLITRWVRGCKRAIWLRLELSECWRGPRLFCSTRRSKLSRVS